MIRHQQIPEGTAFVEPRNVDTVKGLLAAAKELDVDPSTVRTQQGGYLAPTDVVAKWQEGEVGDDVEVTEAPKPERADAPEVQDDGEVADLQPEAPAQSASKADWEAYAAGQGYDPAEGLTKAELIERFGASE